MKLKNSFFITVASFTILTASCSSEENKAEASFKVYGNCGMCEETIEGSLDQKGIYIADWNRDTKMIDVSYDSEKYSLEDLHKLIASVGYDTELERADDEVYEDLHSCCQYERRPM